FRSTEFHLSYITSLVCLRMKDDEHPHLERLTEYSFQTKLCTSSPNVYCDGMGETLRVFQDGVFRAWQSQLGRQLSRIMSVTCGKPAI
ncbi:hypothetical protein BJX66DRAFT_320092, partial [Aspergillus keveii]